MPKLTLFAVCEKVILDQTAKPSLITLFDGVEIRPAQGEEIPPNAVTPKEWSVFAQWLWFDEEKGGDFSQGIAVTYPDGKPFNRQLVKLDSSQPRTNVAMSFLGFPVGQAGDLKVEVWMEQNGTVVTEIFSVVLTVSVKPLEPGKVGPQQIIMKAESQR